MSWRQKYIAAEQKHEFVLRWRASGLSQAEFCRSEDVPEWALSQWKRGVEKSESRKAVSPSRSKSASSAQKIQRQFDERKKHRRDIVAAHAASGLSIREFCRRNSISVNSFNRWLRLEQADATVAGEGGTIDSPGHFVVVNVEEPKVTAVLENSLDIVLPGGSKIRVYEHSPLDLLFKVLNVLEGKR